MFLLMFFSFMYCFTVVVNAGDCRSESLCDDIFSERIASAADVYDVVVFGDVKSSVFFFVVCSYSLCVPVVNYVEMIGKTIDDPPFEIKDAFK